MKFGLLVHGWVYMTNHVHLLLTPKQDDLVSRLMQSLGRRYVGYFNYAHARMSAPHANYLALGKNARLRQNAYRKLTSEALDTNVLAQIRHCVNTGLVLGTEAFRNQVATMLD